MPEPAPIPDIRDIPPPPEVAEPIGVWVWFAGGGVLVAIAGLLVLWHRKSHRPPRPSPPEDPFKTAIDQLHRLKGEATATPAGQLADRVAKAIRGLLAGRFGEASLAMSGSEFLEAHADDIRLHFDAGQREELRHVLESCDRLRFAPDPDDSALRSPLVESALALVHELPPHPQADADSPAQ